jgi:cell wall assembly regulator SMI1
MKAIWDRIHTWLDANAPAGYGDLRPGASADEIRAAEEAMGLKLPDDVVASYRIHDGQDTQARYGRGLVGGEGWRLLPLQEIVEQWGHWSRADPKDARSVPIADIGTGDYVFLDLDPDAEEPVHLMIQRRDTSDPDPFMPSFSFWLEDFVDELEGGEFAYSESHGAVMYADEIDLH